MPACVRRLRPARALHGSHTESQSDQKIHPWQPVSAPQKPVEKQRNMVCAMFSAQRRWPHLRKKTRSVDRRLARHVRLLPKPTLRGPFVEGLSDAGDVRDAGTPRCWSCRNAGDAGKVCEDAEDVGGDAGDCPGRFAQYLQCFFEGRATWSLGCNKHVTGIPYG